MEERQATLDARLADITALEGQIEVERKKLMALTNTFRDTKTGGAEVVVQNMKVSHLMSQRNAIKVQSQWIEEIAGLSLKDIFESTRDVRKIGADLFQVKRRPETIESLYVDLAKAAADEEVAQEATLLGSLIPKKIKAKTTAPAPVAAPTAAADVRQGAIVAQTKKFKLKATGAPGPP
jgi:hypothetical protein